MSYHKFNHMVAPIIAATLTVVSSPASFQHRHVTVGLESVFSILLGKDGQKQVAFIGEGQQHIISISPQIILTLLLSNQQSAGNPIVLTLPNTCQSTGLMMYYLDLIMKDGKWLSKTRRFRFLAVQLLAN